MWGGRRRIGRACRQGALGLEPAGDGSHTYPMPLLLLRRDVGEAAGGGVVQSIQRIDGLNEDPLIVRKGPKDSASSAFLPPRSRIATLAV